MSLLKAIFWSNLMVFQNVFVHLSRPLNSTLAGKISMKKDDKPTYRLMEKGEEKDVYDLILKVFHKHVAPIYSQKGIKTFLGMLSIDFLKETNLEKFTVVAEHNSKLLGMLSIINTNHIALLFVSSEFQNLGIGKGLIQFSINECLKKSPDLKAMTVSSTPNSFSFYEKNGFIKIDEEQNENGMRFVPMQKKLGD